MAHHKALLCSSSLKIIELCFLTAWIANTQFNCGWWGWNHFLYIHQSAGSLETYSPSETLRHLFSLFIHRCMASHKAVHASPVYLPAFNICCSRCFSLRLQLQFQAIYHGIMFVLQDLKPSSSFAAWKTWQIHTKFIRESTTFYKSRYLGSFTTLPHKQSKLFIISIGYCLAVLFSKLGR